MKKFFAKLNRIFLLGARPSMKLSQEWREDNLNEYEQADRKAAGIY